jgi:hypothetical protein
MSEPELVAMLGPDVARVEVNGVVALWVRSKLRKERRCWRCKALIPKGQRAWRPVGNELHRSERVCGCW